MHYVARKPSVKPVPLCNESYPTLFMHVALNIMQ